MAFNPHKVQSIFLDRVEDIELESLEWGYVDGGVTEQELQAIFDGMESLDGIEKYAFDDLLEDLISTRDLYEISAKNGRYIYRTRFSETVRLVRQLKQLFPDLHWSAGADLVSDYRIDSRPREFPIRDLGINTVSDRLKNNEGVNDRAIQAINALLGPAMQLSEFQYRSIARLVNFAESDQGTVITAGTGGGKTIAAYTPIFASFTSLDGTSNHTKALALYPRKELLKDQFSEVFRMARASEKLFNNLWGRPVRIGAYFSDTPFDSEPKYVSQLWNQSKDHSGWICPFLKCHKCSGFLIWLESDVSNKVERLSCQNRSSCDGGSGATQVALTRRSMTSNPPDVVFSTAESLNQRLSDPYCRNLFGLRRPKTQSVNYILLDEIHTYAGVSGAQVANTLRRFRHQSAGSVNWIGLSATIQDASRFFSDLTGVVVERIKEITPSPSEMETGSRQHQLIVRGDASSRRSLVSSTIQLSMLISRMLNRKDALSSKSSGTHYGSKAFVFTDDLDVTNRIFDNLRDAEGRDIFGNPDPAREPLAILRSSGRPEPRERDLIGQNWKSAELISGPLANRLKITRTTSQDPGVLSTSDLIVATASLEVGFDDPTVGAIIQHKSPRHFAQFVQRRGRAGRDIDMRPWMITVLSDYGRDRLTYQSYEHLFGPEVPAEALPYRNIYVMRMQATFSLLDWLAIQCERESLPRKWLWQLLNGPREVNKDEQRVKAKVSELCRELLAGDTELLAELKSHLHRALSLSVDEIDKIIWESPRSLLLEVIPTLLRRLETNWELLNSDGNSKKLDIHSSLFAPNPLPDFLPANLFSDLNLPEVSLRIPAATVRDTETFEMFGIVQTLRQLLPGRITRRFAHQRGRLNHWVPIPTDGSTSYSMPVTQYAFDSEMINWVSVVRDQKIVQVPCYRPWEIHLEKAPANINPSSNARAKWEVEIEVPIEAESELNSVDITDLKPWGGLVGRVDFFLHRNEQPITLKRFTTGVTANYQNSNSTNSNTVDIRFTTEDGTDAAIGFEQSVDGLRFRWNGPNSTELGAMARSSKNLKGWKKRYFRFLVQSDQDLSTVCNFFEKEWLEQCYFAAAVIESHRQKSSLDLGADRLHPKVGMFDEIVGIILGSSSESAENSTDEDSDAAGESGNLSERLLELLDTEQVLARLNNCLKLALTAEGDSWNKWVNDTLHETVAEIVLGACLGVAPATVSAESLVFELSAGNQDQSESDGREIWIAESTLGGGGAIEAIATAISANPREFVNSLDASIAMTDLELNIDGLDRIIDLVHDNSDIQKRMSQVRDSVNNSDHVEALNRLGSEFSALGVPMTKALSLALHHRLLKFGMSLISDQLIWELRTMWTRLQNEIEMAIPLRVFCQIAVTNADYQSRLDDVLIESALDKSQTAERAALLSGILWPKLDEVSGRSLQSYNPFREAMNVDPVMVKDLLLPESRMPITFPDVDWLGILKSQLIEYGMAKVVCESADVVSLHYHLLRAVAEPISVKYLNFYPSVNKIQLIQNQYHVEIGLNERF